MLQAKWNLHTLVVAAIVSSVCVDSRAQTTADVLNAVDAAWRPRTAFRQAVRTYLPPEGTADLRSLKEQELAQIVRAGRQLESRETLVHPTAGYLLDETHEVARQAQGKKRFSIYHRDTYSRIGGSERSVAELWRRDTGGVFGTPVNYAPTAWALELKGMLTADPQAHVEPGENGERRLVFPKLLAIVKIGLDGRVLAIEDNVGSRGVQHRVLLGRIVTPCTGQPLPRYMITGRSRNGDIEFQALTVFDNPVPDTTVTESVFQWWTYRPTAQDRVTGETLGPGGVVTGAASDARQRTPSGNDNKTRLSQEQLRAAKDDPSVVLLPAETPWYRRILFVVGVGFLIGAGAWAVRKRVASG